MICRPPAPASILAATRPPPCAGREHLFLAGVYNRTYAVTSPSSAGFQYNVGTCPGTYTSGGSVTSTLSITGESCTSHVATITVPNGFVKGNIVVIAGGTQAGYRGTWGVVTPGAGSFTFSIAACPPSGTGGTVSPMSWGTSSPYQTSSAFDSAREAVATLLPIGDAANAPNGMETTETLDPAGNVLTSTDPNGTVTTNTYTPEGSLATITYSDSTHSVSNSYDAGGQQLSMVDGTGTTTKVYDPFGELTSSQNGASQTVSYSYDADGSVKSTTYPLSGTWPSKTVTDNYDQAESLTSVTDFAGNSIAATSDANGNTTSISLPTTTTDTISTLYDNTGTPLSINLKQSGSTLLGFSYSETPSGDTLSETDTGSGTTPSVSCGGSTVSTCDTYTPDDSVASMAPSIGSAETYAPDASGNLQILPVGAISPNTGFTPAYTDANQLATSTESSAPSTAYTYSKDGALSAETGGNMSSVSASWNGAGDLTAYNNTDTASGTGADMSSATYDGDGMLTSETSTPAGGTATAENFVNGQGDLLMDSDHAGIVVPGAMIEQVSLATQSPQYLVVDAESSVRGIVDPSGGIAAKVTYDAYGNRPNAVVSNTTWSSGTATISTATANGFSTGQSVTISAVSSSGAHSYDGTFSVTASDSTHFTYSLADDPGTYVSGGDAMLQGIGNSTPVGFGGGYLYPSGLLGANGSNMRDSSTGQTKRKSPPIGSLASRESTAFFFFDTRMVEYDLSPPVDKKDIKYSQKQSAGIVGNLLYESGGKLNPFKRETDCPTTKLPECGIGIAQWTYTCIDGCSVLRWQHLKDFGAKSGNMPSACNKTSHDLNPSCPWFYYLTQVEFVWQELQYETEDEHSGSNALSDLEKAETIKRATHVFEWEAEGPQYADGVASEPIRAQYAKQVWKRYHFKPSGGSK